MPYIRVDLDVRTDLRWLDAPPVLRAGAKALYLDAVSYSGEMLTDGHVPGTVMAGLAAELGLQRRLKTVDFLLSTGHLARTNTGYLIVEWESFHDSRTKVQQRRNDAARRQRASRAQTRLPLSHTPSQRDSLPESQSDTGRDSRAHERTREVEVEVEEDQPRAVAVNPPAAGDTPSPNGSRPSDNDEADEPTAQDLEYLETLTPNLREIP